jgi:hypothetical protein
LLFNFAVEYAIRKPNPGGAEIKWDLSAAVYADDMNLLGENIGTIKKNTDTLIDASKEAGLEVNTKKTRYTLRSRHQNRGQNHS